MHRYSHNIRFEDANRGRHVKNAVRRILFSLLKFIHRNLIILLQNVAYTWQRHIPVIKSYRMIYDPELVCNVLNIEMICSTI